MGFASFDKLMLKKNTSHNNPPAHTAPKQEKLWGKEYWKVMTTNFLLFFAFYLLTPLLPIYLDAQFDANKDIRSTAKRCLPSASSSSSSVLRAT